VLQDKVFTLSEGDRWFERNRPALAAFDRETDLPLRLLELYGVRPESALEIGAANGSRLAAIHEVSGARVVAVELSLGAMLDGKARFPAVEFVRGAAASVPLRESFDLVIFNFVFHWIDRVNLFKAAAEADRLVSDGGFLMIGDFHPSNRLRVRYHHLDTPKLHTYKQNYAAVFLASGLYHPVCLMTADHSSRTLAATASEGERIGVWLLRKELKAHYIEVVQRPS
jgi:ubiquinone/menaquinone biosynthesis C-methylase UbiE